MFISVSPPSTWLRQEGLEHMKKREGMKSELVLGSDNHSVMWLSCDHSKIEELLLREKSQHNKKSLQRGTRLTQYYKMDCAVLLK